jgi:hypothetical protein
MPSDRRQTRVACRKTWVNGLFVILSGACAASLSESAIGGQSGVHIGDERDALVVKINGQLFTRYVFAGAPKPYCWPIVGPTGDPITRAYPMETIEGEKQDHHHQRSLWFTHGLVNGVDFWSETDKSGRQVHRKFEAVESGDSVGRIRAVTDWLAPDGTKVCEDTRELRFYGRTAGINPAARDADRVMDFDVTIRASEGPLTFGDTKEGMFGIRVATSMDVDQKDKKPGGRIINSRGDSDAAAWGKPAEWVDYSGPVNGKMVGVTIMNHPSSFRHPTHWHVRTYGLFAPNPFGLSAFYNDKSKDGSHTVPAGESITFRYRLLLHSGDAESAKPAEAYAAYAQSASGRGAQ